jgi:NADPH2:quinone reductase
MKAIIMPSPGGPEVLKYTDLPTPEITAPGDMLVRLKAAGVNPLDTKLRARGTYYPDRSPTILGCDGAGIVEQTGPEVSRFRVGDEIFFCNGGIGGQPGNYAEYAVINEAFAARKPLNMSFVEAAAAPLVCITAWESLFDRILVKEQNTVLIHGGAGGVGHVAIQLAKTHGARVATTVSSAEKARFAESLGADMVINYKSQNFNEAIGRWTNNNGVDVVLDTVGGAVFVQSFSALRTYGDIVTLLQPAENCDWSTARLKNLRIGLELMLTPMYRGIKSAQAHQADILARCSALVDTDKLRVNVHKTFPLADAAAAHRALVKEPVLGKLVLVID